MHPWLWHYVWYRAEKMGLGLSPWCKFHGEWSSSSKFRAFSSFIHVIASKCYAKNIYINIVGFYCIYSLKIQIKYVPNGSWPFPPLSFPWTCKCYPVASRWTHNVSMLCNNCLLNDFFLILFTTLFVFAKLKQHTWFNNIWCMIAHFKLHVNCLCDQCSGV